MADLHHYLHQLLEHRGSDLHVKAGSVPHLRVDGRLTPLIGSILTPGDLEEMVGKVLSDQHREVLNAFGDVDFALGLSGVGRFRVNVHRQRSSYGIVVRCVPPGLPSWEQLALPAGLKKSVEFDDGLVLVAGPTGSGRSTTAAMLLDHVNFTRNCSIVTLERPIEVLHADKRALVSQREVGDDTPDFVTGITRALRQDCDVVYLSEVPDQATAAAMLAAAGAGRLVLAVITGGTVVAALTGLIDMFPESERPVVRRALAGCLRGVVAQHLLSRSDGRGRMPAVELLMSTNRTFEVIVDPTRPLEHLDKVIGEGQYHGMVPLQQSLYELCVDGFVPVPEAMRLAAAPEDLRISLQRAGLMAS